MTHPLAHRLVLKRPRLRIEQATGIDLLYPPGQALFVVRAPPFIEQHPRRDARVVVERSEVCRDLALEFSPRFRRGVGRWHHVLPDEESDPVAVVVPAVRLDL